MSSLTALEKSYFERLFDMGGGYVLNFSDSSFGTFFGNFNVDIHAPTYQIIGTSKAKKLKAFWQIENDYLVGEVLKSMLEHYRIWGVKDGQQQLLKQCTEACNRLLTGKVNLTSLKQVAEKFDQKFINRQIKRMEDSIEKDPDLAIGTSKELVESCCKTILNELKVSFDEKKLDVPQLAKLTLENLKLVPDSVDSQVKGADIVKRLLGNVGAISHGMAELRNLYGTGHGKSGTSGSLNSRHARLAVNCATAFVHFVFDTYIERTK
jgi:hypothetical protein